MPNECAQAPASPAAGTIVVDRQEAAGAANDVHCAAGPIAGATPEDARLCCAETFCCFADAAGAVTAGGIRRPTPERLPVGPLTNFGNTGEVALAVPISVPAASVVGEPLLLARGALVGLRGSAHCRIGDAGAYGQRSPRPRARRPPATVYSSFSLPGLSASTRHLLRHPAAFALRGRAPAAPSERRAGRPPARAACRSNCR